MRLSQLIPLLACFLTLALATPAKDPGNKAMRRIEREKALQRQLQQTKDEKPKLDAWMGLQDQEPIGARLSKAIAYIDMKTLQQTYLFLVDEYGNGVIRRKSACRYTTSKRGDRGNFYVSFLFLNFL